MTATISAGNGAGTTTPVDILSPYSVERVSRNIVHDLVGGGIAVSLAAPRPRSGVLELLYLSDADAFGCLELHAQETVFTVTDTGTPAVNMSYVVDGAVSVRLDADTLTVWIVAVGYQEIAP